MKALLNAVKSRLDSQLTYLSKVIIVTDENEVLEDAAHPFIALADRGLRREYLKWSRKEYLTVRVIAYQEILREEATLMGSGAKKGVIDILADAETALWNNYLGLPGYYDVQIAAHLPAELVISENQFSARRAMDVTYFREFEGE